MTMFFSWTYPYLNLSCYFNYYSYCRFENIWHTSICMVHSIGRIIKVLKFREIFADALRG